MFPPGTVHRLFAVDEAMVRFYRLASQGKVSRGAIRIRSTSPSSRARTRADP
jgi:hypothetical protein